MALRILRVPPYTILYMGLGTASARTWAWPQHVGDIHNTIICTIIVCRKLATFHPEHGIPDGLTLDSQGRIWTALAKGSAVVCLDPETGAELHRSGSN